MKLLAIGCLRGPGVAFDMVVLDLDPGEGKPAAEVNALAAERRVLIISASASSDDVLATTGADADSYLVKSADLEAAPAQSGTVCLAPREREVLVLIAQGFTQAQAASKMGVSPVTIDTYIKRIRRKLGPGNKADLTRRAIELGLIEQRSAAPF